MFVNIEPGAVNFWEYVAKASGDASVRRRKMSTSVVREAFYRRRERI